MRKHLGFSGIRQPKVQAESANILREKTNDLLLKDAIQRVPGQQKIIQPVLSDPKERGGIWPILDLRVHMCIYIYIYMCIYMKGWGFPKALA